MNRIYSILHVEDDANDVYFVARALRDSGVELPVTVAPDGQAAIDLLIQLGASRGKGECPCLVLLDLNLPRRSGLEVLEWIRHQAGWKTMVVLVLTSSNAEADMIRAYSLGANAYVVKPSDATKLREFGRLLKEFWLGWNQIPPPPP